MHSDSHAACIYQLDSFLFNLQGLTHASFYTNELLHQPAFTNTLLHQSLFAETHFNTNQLLHKPAFTQLAFPQNTFYTNQLFSTNHRLHKPGFAPTNLYKPVFTQISFYTNHLLHQSAVHNPWARPKARGAECRNYQLTCFQCVQLNDQRSSTVNLLTISLLSLLSLLRLAFGGGCLRKRLSLDQTELISWATWRFARSMNSWKRNLKRI
jgi:hypothetical protein